MSTYFGVLKKYATFSGRASRREYWMFVLMHSLAIFGLLLLSFIIPALFAYVSPALGIILLPIMYIAWILFMIATIIPSLAVQVRRLHDTNKSGWFLLIPIVPFIFTLMRGTEGSNSYGEDPYSNSENTQNLM